VPFGFFGIQHYLKKLKKNKNKKRTRSYPKERERESEQDEREKLHQREQTLESIANVEDPLMQYKHKIGKRVNREKKNRGRSQEERENVGWTRCR
jgi:hypothetical protein